MKSNTDLWYDLDNIANVFKASELHVQHQLRSVQHTETYNKKWACGEQAILQNTYQSQYLQVYISPILTHQIAKAMVYIVDYKIIILKRNELQRNLLTALRCAYQ